MPATSQKEKINTLILQGKLEAAINALLELFQGNDDYNDVVLMSARFHDLSRRTRINVIDPSTAAVERNRIVSSLLSILESVPDDEVPEPLRSERAKVKTVPVDKRKKLALVIGCSEYQHSSKLKNPINDAKGMAAQLEALGFTVSIRENPDLKAMKMAVDDFGVELANFDVGLFYFAGHGIQVNGSNYLIPVEADLPEERFVEYNCVRADRVLTHMERAKTSVNLMVLDACRNNPFARSWQRSLGSRGLAPMDAPRGSLIAYATAPGKTASDGEGEHGLYTGKLMEHINAPGDTINQIFQNVRCSVMNASNDSQVPWEATSLTADFYFQQ